MIGTSLFMHRSSGSIFIEHAKNVYYTSQNDLVEVSIFYDRMTDDLNVFVGPRYPKVVLYSTALSSSIKNRKVFVCKEYYDDMVELVARLDTYNYTPANVAYYLDEEELCFVDDADGTKVNVIPPIPHREGYEFVGWYKDLSFNEPWDFENDVIPAKEYDQDGNYIFKETRIFSKWKEKE
jgi:uncharacterized repeat protein (TIGR02543 family)